MSVEVIDLLMPFCEAGSISAKQSSVRKRIIASLAFVDTEALYCKVFGPNSHIDRPNVRKYLSEASHTPEVIN